MPLFCEDIFKSIKDKEDAGDKTTFEVKFSMLEIYNEVVRDLLNPSKGKGGLKVRQHPKKGFYGRFTHLRMLDYLAPIILFLQI